MEVLAQHIESLIFTAEQPISFSQIKSCIEEVFEQKFKNDEIEASIQKLIDKYQDDSFSFEVIKIAKGYTFLTKGSFHNTIGSLLKKTNQKRLSRAALETLAIIAYKQPVTKSGVENIRGVSCDYTIQKLLEKELVAITGRSEGPGKPIIYGTSDKFMDYFGLADIDSLPQLKDLKVPDVQIGEPAPIEEVKTIQKGSIDEEE